MSFRAIPNPILKRHPNHSIQTIRPFSVHRLILRRVYVITNNDDQDLNYTQSNETHEIRDARSRMKSTKGQVTSTWICIDSDQLDLRKRYLGGFRRSKDLVGRLVGMSSNGTQTTFKDLSRPLISSNGDQNQSYDSSNVSVGSAETGSFEISVPIKPKPPGSEECCMSGCAHCVYDIYLEELDVYRSAMRDINQQIQTLGNVNLSPDLQERLLPEDSTHEEQDLDPSTRAFLQLERKLKDKNP